jgi:ubiquinone/menaquinone biosynthesis C-methylase UbiE
MSNTNRQLDEFAQVMKRDWDNRARENARWFVNTATHDQTEDEFDASGAREMSILVLPELSLMAGGRDPQSLRLLEIGCGAGRMTKHFARIFGEVHSTDVSGEMIRQARERLRDFPNVHFHETNGVDFAALPDEYFDVVFSAYVFQHVPSKAVIVSNIRDAWRVTEPGGLLKLHTNGVEAVEYEALEKDTWAGATFSESEIRKLARDLGAQLVSIYGAGTGYCWTTLRKRIATSGVPAIKPAIEFFARADDATIRRIPTGGDDAWLSLAATGLDGEWEDANNLLVEINGQPVLPRYVGRVRPHFEEALRQLNLSPEELTYIEAGIPAGTASGVAQVRIKLESGEVSPPVEAPMDAPQTAAPIIFTVRNAHDHGTDIHARGLKSMMLISVVGLDETASCDNVKVKVGDHTIRPSFVGFVTGIADYRVDAQLPDEIARGMTTLSISFGDVESALVNLEIKE